MISIKVPGKVMLSGEYAVLYGGTAVLVPVPFYLKLNETELAPEKKYSPIVIEALAYHIPEIIGYEEEHGKPHVEIDADEFFSKDNNGNFQKLGIGLSAAEAVGIIALRFERAGLSWQDIRQKVAEYADLVHHKVQGGIGSGADIAACAYCQTIKFRRIDDKLDIEPVELREAELQIPIKLIWTGKPADTRVLVKDFQKWLDFGGDNAKNLLNMLIHASHELADQWFVQNRNIFFQSFDNFISVMDEIAVSSGLRFLSPDFTRFAKEAKKIGGRVKSTGAGGGDMVLIIGDVSIDKIDKMVILLNY
jgi:mevalonate kinase